MAGRKPLSGRATTDREASPAVTPAQLVEWLRTLEPLAEEFPEIEDFPPEPVPYFDDFDEERVSPGKRTPFDG